MSTSRENLFWLGFGTLVIVAAKCISWHASEASRFTRIAAEHELDVHEEVEATQKKVKSQQTDDDISLETLAVLIDHPNYDIRHAARKIVLNRFAKNAECCVRLSKDYFNSENFTEAKQVMNEILCVADEESLMRAPYSGSSDDTDISIDRILQAASQRQAASERQVASQRQSITIREGSRLPFVPRENGGNNGEVVSLSLEELRTAGNGESAPSAVFQEREESPEELALRRWRRREAMVVEVDADGGIAQLVLPSR